MVPVAHARGRICKTMRLGGTRKAMKSFNILLSAGAALLFIGGCQSARSTAGKEAAVPPTVLDVPMLGSTGQTIGLAKLSEVPEGVRIQLQVSGLKPGLHGLHFHEKPVCEAPDFTTAGSHFNPFHKEHGFENPKGAHAGDLPNLLVDEQGKAQVDFITQSVALAPDKPNSLYHAGGTSLVIHEQADDLKTDPAGNSGKRIACGVVK